MLQRLSRVVTAGLGVLGPLAVAGMSAPAAGVTTAATATFHRPVIAVAANQSNNWSGYNQGTLERGGTLFHAVAGTWTVPTATPHLAGENEYSASWVGIGGGCVDARCSIGDGTLIQAGTSQDIDKAGRAHYYAWWELIPAPSVTIPNFPVRAGDRITVRIAEALPGSEVWTFRVHDWNTGKVWTQTVPYSSSHLTAEWIEETPVVVDNNGNVSVGPLPKLSTVHFDNARTNGAAAGLKRSEEMQLVDFNNHVLLTPSAPDPDHDGFNDCSYATGCAAPPVS